MEIDPKVILKHISEDGHFKGEQRRYWQSMTALPKYDYSNFYSRYEDFSEIITQGDVLSGLDYIRLPTARKVASRAMVFSNTCDVHIENERLFSSSILYAPIMKLSTFEDSLKLIKKEDGTPKYNDKDRTAYLDKIRNQGVGQIFYLPAGDGMDTEAIVFFDRICSNDNAQVRRDNLEQTKIVSLSAYGWHIFLERLALFFTRTTDDTVQFRFMPDA